MAMIKLLEYTFDNTVESNLLPVFTGVGTTEVIDEVGGNITKRIINVEETALPTKITFHSATGKLALQTIEYMNTLNLKDMSTVFYGCSNLTKVNSSDWDLSNVTTMNGIFTNCTNLVEVDVSNWVFPKVKTLASLFSGCQSLTSLDVSKWDTSNTTNMESMFNKCSSLTSLDISNFDTSNVTNMSNMFSTCSSLTTLDISNFDMSNVTSTNNMFYKCNSLKDIGLLYSPTSTVNIIASLLPATTNKKIYYQDAIPSDLTSVNNVEFVEYKSNTITTEQSDGSIITLRRVGNVCDTLDLESGEYVQRIGERPYQEGDENDATVLTDKVNTYYQLATPITTTIDIKQHPYVYKDGYINLSSNSEKSLIPSIEYSLPINRSGQVSINAQLVQKQQKQLDELESMIIANMVNTQYKQTLSNVEHMLGGE